MFDTLEARRLLSTGVTVTETGGALEVVGGADGSFIDVQEHSGHVIVKSPAGNTIYDSQATVITSINITGQAKVDHIFYTGDSVGAVINGGGGNDEIIIDDQGSAGSVAYGSGGSETFVVLRGATGTGTKVYGGGGADVFELNTAADVTGANIVYAYGEGGHDVFFDRGGTVYTDATKIDTVN